MATLSSLRGVLRAIATAVVPETAALDEREWSELERVIERALDQRDERVRRQLLSYVRLLQLLTIVRYGRPLTRLDARRRAQFLSLIERSPILLLRRGFWGLRTLIFMGYYTRPDVAEEIGYRAHVRGWAARGGTVASVPLSPAVWVEP